MADNRIQSRTLATLRDTLRPKLLSGELSVAGAAREAMPSMKGGMDRTDPMDKMDARIERQCHQHEHQAITPCQNHENRTTRTRR